VVAVSLKKLRQPLLSKTASLTLLCLQRPRRRRPNLSGQTAGTPKMPGCITVCDAKSARSVDPRQNRLRNACWDTRPCERRCSAPNQSTYATLHAYHPDRRRSMRNPGREDVIRRVKESIGVAVDESGRGGFLRQAKGRGGGANQQLDTHPTVRILHLQSSGGTITLQCLLSQA